MPDPAVGGGGADGVAVVVGAVVVAGAAVVTGAEVVGATAVVAIVVPVGFTVVGAIVATIVTGAVVTGAVATGAIAEGATVGVGVGTVTADASGMVAGLAGAAAGEPSADAVVAPTPVGVPDVETTGNSSGGAFPLGRVAFGSTELVDGKANTRSADVEGIVTGTSGRGRAVPATDDSVARRRFAAAARFARQSAALRSVRYTRVPQVCARREASAFALAARRALSVDWLVSLPPKASVETTVIMASDAATSTARTTRTR